MLGILCGFAAEAVIARKISPLVACSGAYEAGARKAARDLVARGATSLLSFGVAGGLVAGITPEDIVVGRAVKGAEGKSWPCTPSLVAALLRAAPQARQAEVYGSTVLLAKPADKKKLYAETNCLIVDMESQIVAEVASALNLPFGVLRGVSDGVEETFPTAALKGINPDGSTNNAAVLFSLLKNPLQLPALRRLFKHTGTALGKLDAVAKKGIVVEKG